MSPKKTKLKLNYVSLGGTWDKHDGNDGGFVLNWKAEGEKEFNGGIQFGQISFVKRGSQVECDDEGMGKKFVDEAVKLFLKNIEYK